MSAATTAEMRHVPSPASVRGAAAESRVRQATPASAMMDATRVFPDNPERSPAAAAMNGTSTVCNWVMKAALDAEVYCTPSICSVEAPNVSAPS